MLGIMDPVVDGVTSLFSWLGAGLKLSADSYCELETAENNMTLVARDGSLVSILKVEGATALIGAPEFERLHAGVTQSLQATLNRYGHSVQVFFSYDRDAAKRQIADNYRSARQTASTLGLDLQDLFDERIEYFSRYCADETLFFVLWTRPSGLTKEQRKRISKEKLKHIRKHNLPSFGDNQNLIAAIPDLRNAHDAFLRSTLNDFSTLDLQTSILNVHEALREVRMSVDPDFTDDTWSPVLPGDKIPLRVSELYDEEISDVLYPPLSQQLIPRDSERVDFRTMRIGERIYTSVLIDLFPKDVKSFMHLFNRVHATQIPWRISFLVQSNGLVSAKMRKLLAGVLGVTSAQNRLLNDALHRLQEIQVNAEDAVVRLQVCASTWAPEDDIRLLRTRTSLLAKALQGWGSAEVTEMTGDPFGAVVSSMLGISGSSEATSATAPLSDVVYMLPLTRPASPWKTGAILFRSPDGKLWPYQPGSVKQTTWIDILYARPGSGKSVLSNVINLALALSPGLKHLPRISIIDIGPSSSGLISLLKEALPPEKRHYVAAYRLRMTQDYSINPFDTQLGSRFPTPQERGFLVNFLTLLATPIGDINPYDGVAEMAGMIVDELYKALEDKANPYTYTPGLDPLVDEILEEIGFVKDQHTTWWEVTDALFLAGFSHEAMLAQRYAMPLLADAASICRQRSVEDLYGNIKVSTGESLIDAFARMISSSVREYPILSRVTRFDLGEAKIVSLDLDEVAKTGGDAADRQTAVMYMLARYILGRDFYLSEENVSDMNEQYRDHHRARIMELRDDPKRLVYDEFHRTSHAKAVRDQVLVDMREGRKWKVQVAIISQSLEDFDSTMIEFATSVYIMDAGPAQAVKKTAEVFGLSETARTVLSSRVHGPREGGSTFLAQFATKEGLNTQLLTCTIGPIELWAFSTTAEDAKLRNSLYRHLGPVEARRLLARLFPSGTATKLIETRLEVLQEQGGLIMEDDRFSIIDHLIEEILAEYAKNPNITHLVT